MDGMSGIEGILTCTVIDDTVKLRKPSYVLVIIIYFSSKNN